MNLLFAYLLFFYATDFVKAYFYRDNDDFDPYKVLKTSESSSFVDITKRYRQLIKVYQPALGGDPKIFEQIQKAYEILQDEWFEKGYPEYLSQQNVVPKTSLWYIQNPLIDLLLITLAYVGLFIGFIFSIFFVGLVSFGFVSVCCYIFDMFNGHRVNVDTYGDYANMDFLVMDLYSTNRLSQGEISFLDRITNILRRRGARSNFDNFVNGLKTMEYDVKFFNQTCSICLLNFEETPQKLLVKAPCTHTFHRECLVEWLKKSGTCPNCRFDFLSYRRPGNAVQDDGIFQFEIEDDNRSESHYSETSSSSTEYSDEFEFLDYQEPVYNLRSRQ